MRLLRAVTWLVLTCAVCGCADDEVIEHLLVDDVVRVEAEIIGPRGELIPFAASLDDSTATFLAVDLFGKGWLRDDNASLVAYLTAVPQLSGIGRDHCNVTEGEEYLNFTRDPSREDFYLEFITDFEGNEDCFLTEEQIRATIRPGAYQLGKEVGNVSLSLNVDSGSFVFTEYFSDDGGELIITEVDYLSAEVIGTPGLYFTFEVQEAQLDDFVPGVPYQLQGLRGRMFVGWPR